MSVAEIEAALTPRLAEFSALEATVKFVLGSDHLFIDGTTSPATLTHDDGEADCTLILSADNMVKILQGHLDPTMAFMTGMLKVTGSTSIAMKLAGVLKE
jgi:putative sterol carrier protein